MGSLELLVIAIATFALVGYCLTEALRAHASARRAGQDGLVGWIVLLGVGFVVWPVGWVASVAYLSGRRRISAR